MRVLDAAIQVLQEAGEPLRVEAITERILSRGLWQTAGKTPVATVGAALYTDVKRRGSASPFVRRGSGTFGLRQAAALAKPAEDMPPETASPQVGPPLDETYSFTDSAERVLEHFGGRRPMHYRAITDKALAMGWLVTEGKTPAATMYARILADIKRSRRRGEQPRFVQHGKGLISLARWAGHGLAFQIEQHNRGVRRALRERLFAIEWDAFEDLIARLLAEMGFEDIEVTTRSKDGGIDVRGTLVVGDVIRTHMAIQVKRWRRNVQAPVVQQVRGSLGTHEQGLIVTTSGFSAGARKEAARPDATPVALMNGEQLVLLLTEHSIGVSRQSHDLFELDEPPDAAADMGTAAQEDTSPSHP